MYLLCFSLFSVSLILFKIRFDWWCYMIFIFKWPSEFEALKKLPKCTEFFHNDCQVARHAYTRILTRPKFQLTKQSITVVFFTLVSVYSKWEWLWEIILYMVISATHLWLQVQKHHLHAAQQAANQKCLFKGRVPLKREELKQLVSTRGWTEGGLTKAQYSIIINYIHTKLL